MTRRGAAVRAVVTAAVVCGLALFAAACGSSSKSGGSSGSGKANFSVTLPDGQVSLSLSGALPPGWPSDFPVPPNSKVAGTGSVGGKETTRSVAVYSSTLAAADAYHFYAQNANLHVSDTNSAGVGNAFIGKMTLVSPYKGSLAVVGHSDTTYIVIELETAGGGAAPTTAAP
jgi:hypothetical protein